MRSVVAIGAATGLLAIAGCGADQQTDAKAPTAAALPSSPPAAKVDAFSGQAGAAQFRSVAAAVCSTALTGLPRAPGMTRPGKRVTAYAKAALPAIARVDQSLGTLAQQRPESATDLSRIRQDLAAVTASLQPVAVSTKADVSPLRSALARAQSDATGVRFPACAPS